MAHGSSCCRTKSYEQQASSRRVAPALQELGESQNGWIMMEKPWKTMKHLWTWMIWGSPHRGKRWGRSCHKCRSWQELANALICCDPRAGCPTSLGTLQTLRQHWKAVDDQPIQNPTKPSIRINPHQTSSNHQTYETSTGFPYLSARQPIRIFCWTRWQRSIPDTPKGWRVKN